MKKKTYQKYVGATLVTALAASSVVVAAPTAQAATSFSDVKPGEYYYDAVMNLSSRGVINGFPDGTFKPNQGVTRGQAAKIIAGALGLDTKNVKNPGFKDVDVSNEYYGAIAALANTGIISGYQDGTFRPTAPVQRNHMAKIIVNAFGLKASANAKTPFTDVLKEYEGYITALYENKVTTGRTATQFDGLSYVTRGQLATFVVRAESTLPKDGAKALTQALAEAEKINEADYTPLSYGKLKSAVEAAKKLDANATNEQKLNAANAIIIAINNLEKKESQGNVTVITASSSISILAEDVPVKIGVTEYTADIATVGTGDVKDVVITFDKKVPEIDNVDGFEFTVSNYDFTVMKVDNKWQLSLRKALELEGKSITTPVTSQLEDQVKQGKNLYKLKLSYTDASTLTTAEVAAIKKENPDNYLEIVVDKNTVYNAKAEFTFNSLLIGSVTYGFAVFKEKENGSYDNITGNLAKDNPKLKSKEVASYNLNNLDEGKYIVLLDAKNVLSLVDNYTFRLVNQKVDDYSKAVISGNLAKIEGQAFSGKGTILSVNGKSINKENTIIEGIQGALKISPDGTFSYVPNLFATVGTVEKFEYTIGYKGLTPVKGLITITIEE